jgi:hypothetical protein
MKPRLGLKKPQRQQMKLGTKLRTVQRLGKNITKHNKKQMPLKTA